MFINNTKRSVLGLYYDHNMGKKLWEGWEGWKEEPVCLRNHIMKINIFILKKFSPFMFLYGKPFSYQVWKFSNVWVIFNSEEKRVSLLWYMLFHQRLAEWNNPLTTAEIYECLPCGWQEISVFSCPLTIWYLLSSTVSSAVEIIFFNLCWCW